MARYPSTFSWYCQRSRSSGRTSVRRRSIGSTNFAFMVFGFTRFAIGIEFMRSYPPGNANGLSTEAPMAKRKAATTRKTTGARATASKRRKAAKRELIDTGTDKRYLRRNPDRAATSTSVEQS